MKSWLLTKFVMPCDVTVPCRGERLIEWERFRPCPPKHIDGVVLLSESWLHTPKVSALKHRNGNVSPLKCIKLHVITMNFKGPLRSLADISTARHIWKSKITESKWQAEAEGSNTNNCVKLWTLQPLASSWAMIFVLWKWYQSAVEY